MSSALLSCAGVRKAYGNGGETLEVLGGMDLDVGAGDTVAIQGVSGSGKSTLLQILGDLMAPDAGSVRLGGDEYSGMSEGRLCEVRNRKLGFVYQSPHLMGEFSAMENVAIPLLVRRTGKAKAFARARSLLERVGLADCERKKPGQMSGGERQRAAVARALAGDPECVIADEPTGSLDWSNADKVFGLLVDLCAEGNVALVTATHDDRLARRTKARYTVAGGRLEECR